MDRSRVIIDRVEPTVDAGRFALKRCINDTLMIRARAFCDGHDQPRCELLWRHWTEQQWSHIVMNEEGWDHWQAGFRLPKLGIYYYTVIGWVDAFRTWREDLRKRAQADQDIDVDLRIGAAMVRAAQAHAEQVDAPASAASLAAYAVQLESANRTQTQRANLAQERPLAHLMCEWAERRAVTRYQPELRVDVEPTRARFSSWYELFPRSPAVSGPPPAGTPPEHATLSQCKERLDYAADLGFNIVYLPPIHPIGQTHRKGANNATKATADDVGSPWAIGSAAGGHKSVHPRLGTLEDFKGLVGYARDLDLDIALDIAFQVSPDHPYVAQHPQWFRERPDGTIQYAENPPKKYEDIYPFDFETQDWRALWAELASIFAFWCDCGVRVFRVDNPHTKPFNFWEWLIPTIKTNYPETIFLSEAFARPAVMHRLAKLGFSQSYTYFTWRNSKHELSEYLREVTRPEMLDFMRPNFWPNTPDILHETLQNGRRATFMLRAALAATMSSNYGIYGPAFELMEHVPRHPGSEEYLDSEKYQLRTWNLNQTPNITDFIRRLNRIRAENSALQQNRNTTIHGADNDAIFVFSKRSDAHDNFILVVANLSAAHTHSATVELDLEALGLDPERHFHIHDLVDDARYIWRGRHNFVELTPQRCPVHIFRIGERPRNEQDFDYYF
ncbi:alpha-1,4-glucan--maltose-1-phosphate maltosyltransferase [Bradymonas sediminis]|uniref:Alpha-1,4-glucan:maltose-1-phosphate maltosyltransferase n=1 Tax=Bradymonas sediminis TaxID=1548548 RepID=A0A2Z4FHX8_9DELT|nr:alpha-1,4-glucan--maltose-1-phosphate maltosyltransferase [Bradymonas sediminis]AWV88493.1 alpha-1,4-glucan--maltose-1-phosphate maltosyltransferase [Bradymonas sediminis]TDP77626.1 alpha-1,4-glucan:maltose-1-phosphate maltosyltransferase [Bradymonas sediminis]